MLTKEQIAERRNYIGGSDCAAVLGLSRWETPISVWAIKTGSVEAEDISDRLPIEVGHSLEDLVCKLWTKRTGKALHRVNETQTHPNFPFIRCNIDRRVVGENTIFEAKTCSAWKAKEWLGEECPQEYVLQCLHNMAVTGADKCELAVLVGGNVDFIYKTIQRDPVLIAEIIRKEVFFWTNFIEPRIFPTTITKNDADILFKLFPNAPSGSEIALGDEANQLAESLEGLRSDYANLDGIIEKEKNSLRAMLGTNEVGITDRFRITWRNQESSRVDADKLRAEYPQIYEKVLKKTPSRVLRINKIKKTQEK